MYKKTNIPTYYLLFKPKIKICILKKKSETSNRLIKMIGIGSLSVHYECKIK